MKKISYLTICILTISTLINQAHASYNIEAQITQKTEAYIEIPEALNLKRESFSKYIYHTPYPNAVPIPYTDDLIDMITQKIW